MNFVYNASGEKNVFFSYFIYLTRNLSTLMNDPCFIWFSSVNECKHKPDQSMLVLYPASSVVGSWHPSCVHGKAFSRSTLEVHLSVPACRESQL